MTTNVAMNESPDIFSDLPSAAHLPDTILPLRLKSKLFVLRILFRSKYSAKLRKTLLQKEMSSYDTSLFDYDPGFYEVVPHKWMAGKFVPGGGFTWSRKAVDAALKLDLKDSDVIIATYPKTGKKDIIIMCYIERCLSPLVLLQSWSKSLFSSTTGVSSTI